jgi:hypothetical protein
MEGFFLAISVNVFCKPEDRNDDDDDDDIFLNLNEPHVDQLNEFLDLLSH